MACLTNIIRLMKKLFLFIMCSFVFSIANAQNGWTSTLHEADALKKTKEYTSYCYKDDQGNSFIYWSNSNNFRLINAEGVFDVDINEHVKVIVGYYDLNDNLIKQENKRLSVEADDYTMVDSYTSGKKMIEYLNNEKGYLRILCPTYQRVSPVEIKVPCKNNEQ